MVWDDITELVGRARGGDRAAMGALCERFTPTVFATAMARLRNSAEAEEVVQETFLCCVRKLRQLHDDSRFAGWLRRIADRLAITRLTRRAAVKDVQADTLDRAEDPDG